MFTALLVGIGQIAGYYWGISPSLSLLIFLIPALIINFILYFFSAKMVLKSYRAIIVTPEQAPRLHRIVDRVALRADVPKPTVAVIPSATPNAFATGRNPKNAVVAATDGILRLLDDDELEGVIAHEMGHVKNRDILISTIAAALASVISFIAWGFLFARDRNANPLIGILMFLLAPLAAAVVQMAISRSRELAADETGARLTGNPLPLARALQKLEAGVHQQPMQGGNPSTSSLFIVNPFRGRSLVRLFSTHPPTEERVRRLERMVF